MAAEVDPAEESVVLASFASRRDAEHMLASLGRAFRKTARKGHAKALVVSANSDGSLKLTQSRVVTAGAVASTLIRVSLHLAVGLIGVIALLKGAQSGAHAAHLHEAHVESDEQALHAILARAGTNAAAALVCCDDRETRDAVATRAAERGSYSWNGSRTAFLAGLDPGSQHDWVRAALGEPASTNR